MPDLADRISRAAVAALDLAPFDDRFAALSRQVLAGGALRFSRILDQSHAISYILPVGVAGERIDYGALALQPNAAGLVWRDADGVDHHASVSVTPATPATYAEVELGGEPWVRFSVGGASRLTFLVPPVKSRALIPMLVDHFGATPGPAPTTVLPEPTPAPALVRFPDPPPVAPSPAPPAAGPTVQAGAPEAPQAPEAPVDATTVLPYDPQALLDGAPTQVIAPVPVEAEVAWPPSPSSAPQGQEWATAIPTLSPSEPTPAPRLDLFRDAPRPPADPEPTRVLDTQALPPGPVQPWQPPRPPAAAAPVSHTALSARREPISAADAFVPVAQGNSLTLRGFLVALLATLGVGAAFIVFQLIA